MRDTANALCKNEIGRLLGDSGLGLKNRVVRRCFLLGDDRVTGKNYDHRKAWIEELLRRQAAFFGIDLLGFAILSNHFPLILRSRPDVVATWDDSEVARRLLPRGDCPLREPRPPDSRPPKCAAYVDLNPIRGAMQDVLERGRATRLD